jgi:hypothetical protein
MENDMGPKLAKAAEAAPLLQMAYGHGPMFDFSPSPSLTAAAAAAASPAAAAAGGGSAAAGATGGTVASSSSSSRGTSTAAKAAIVAAAAAAAGEASDSDEPSEGDIGMLLQRALRHKMINMVAVAWVQASTYSKLQLCLLHVASWPFGPVGGEVWGWGLWARQQQGLQGLGLGQHWGY